MESSQSAPRLRTRSLAATAALLVTAAGCASLPALHDAGGPAPLEARLYEPLGGVVHFAVSQPAYVAVFEIAPGGGMRMLFPSSTYQAQRRIAGGYSFTPSRFAERDRLTFASSWSRGISPTYLLLIASERPLRVERMVNAPWNLRSELGLATFYSASASVRTIERLAERIVPDPYTSDWAYDTYVVWPTMDVQVPRVFPVVCADGTVRMIRGTRVPLDCLQPPPPQPDSVKPPTSDSAAVSPRFRGRPPRSAPENGGTTVTRGRGAEDGDATRERSGTRSARGARPGESGDSWGGRVGSRAGRGYSRPADAERGSARGEGTAPGRQSGARGETGRPSAGARSEQSGRGSSAGGSSGGSRTERVERERSRERSPSANTPGERRGGGSPPSAEGSSGERATQ